MSDDQYGDYSRRGEYEGQDPYAGRRGYRTRGTDPGYAGPPAPRAEDQYGAPPPAGGYGGGRGDTAYPRSYGRDYSGRDTGAGADAGGAPPPAGDGYQAGGYSSGYPAGGDYGTGEYAGDYSTSRSYRRGEYRPRGGEYGRDGYGEPTRSRRDVLGVIASSLFAVLAVVALVMVLWLIFKGDDDPGGTPTAEDTGLSASPSTDPSTDPSNAASQPPVDVKAPVVVLNSTGVTGLAGAATEQIGAAEWETREPSNYQPPLPETTVFYPEGMEDAAATLQRAFPDVLVVEPADDSMATDALTLVLGANWPTE